MSCADKVPNHQNITILVHCKSSWTNFVAICRLIGLDQVSPDFGSILATTRYMSAAGNWEVYAVEIWKILNRYRDHRVDLGRKESKIRKYKVSRLCRSQTSETESQHHWRVNLSGCRFCPVGFSRVPSTNFHSTSEKQNNMHLNQVFTIAQVCGQWLELLRIHNLFVLKKIWPDLACARDDLGLSGPKSENSGQETQNGIENKEKLLTSLNAPTTTWRNRKV